MHRKSRECHYRRHLSNLFCINTLLVFLFAEPTMVRYATEPENASKCKFYRDFSLPVCSHSRTFVNRVTYVGLLVSLYQLCGPARTDTLDCQEHNVKSTVTTWDNSSAEVKFLGYFERHFTFCTRQTQTSDFIWICFLSVTVLNVNARHLDVATRFTRTVVHWFSPNLNSKQLLPAESPDVSHVQCVPGAKCARFEVSQDQNVPTRMDWNDF